MRCIAKDSWICLKILLNGGFHLNDHSILEELAQIYQCQEQLQFVLSHQIQEIEAYLVTQAPKKRTLLITDPRCLEHAGFDKYHNVARRKAQKEEQPENAERLMVLIDSDHGVLT